MGRGGLRVELVVRPCLDLDRKQANMHHYGRESFVDGTVAQESAGPIM